MRCAVNGLNTSLCDPENRLASLAAALQDVLPSTANPLLQVWVGGQLWATTAEASNVNSDLSYSIGLTRIAVTGFAYWQVLLGCG